MRMNWVNKGWVSWKMVKNYRSLMNFAAHIAFELPISLRRNRNCRFKLDRSMVSISMTWILQKPINPKSFNSSQPNPPAPITRILHVFMINSKPSVDGVNSGWQNGPDRSNILRTWTHRFAWISDDGDDVSIWYAIRMRFLLVEWVWHRFACDFFINLRGRQMYGIQIGLVIQYEWFVLMVRALKSNVPNFFISRCI